jgi:hypothetical protein
LIKVVSCHYVIRAWWDSERPVCSSALFAFERNRL